MADIFGGSNIVQLRGDYDSIGPRVTIKVDGSRISDRMHILSAAGAGKSNIQIDLTFNEHIIITAFGEQVTNMVFDAVAMPVSCDTGRTSSGYDMGAFYRKYRAGTNKNKTPIINISYDGNVFLGVLHAMQVKPYNLQDIDASLYSMTILGNFR